MLSAANVKSAAAQLNSLSERRTNGELIYTIVNEKTAWVNALYEPEQTSVKLPRYIIDDGVKYPITEVWLQNGKLTSLDVSECKDLETLWCSYNYITTLDVRSCTALKSLSCGNNALISLYVSGCTQLEELYCYNNMLTSLDLSNTDMNSPTATLYCVRNFFESLDSIIGLTNTWQMFTDMRLSYHSQTDRMYFPLRNFYDIGWSYIWDGDPLWYIPSILFAVNNSLFAGISPDEFAPYSPMTRAMLVTVMHRYAKLPGFSAGNRFTDVTADAWFANAVAWAAENNIVAGISATEFAPDANVTREQFAAILYRYARDFLKTDVSKTTELKFKDKEDISAYALSAVKWCVANGIIEGKDVHTVDPQGNATRAEVATMIYQFDKVLNNP